MAQFLYALTSSNINRFSKLFYCQNQEKTCKNIITKDPTTPQEVTRQGRMALTGVNAQNNIKCQKQLKALRVH